jgi:hypothetical protein
LKLTTFEKHQKKIAEDVLKIPDEMMAVATVITKKEAREMLDKLAKKELEEESEKI